MVWPYQWTDLVPVCESEISSLHDCLCSLVFLIWLQVELIKTSTANLFSPILLFMSQLDSPHATQRSHRAKDQESANGSVQSSLCVHLHLNSEKQSDQLIQLNWTIKLVASLHRMKSTRKINAGTSFKNPTKREQKETKTKEEKANIQSKQAALAVLILDSRFLIRLIHVIDTLVF